MTLFLLSFQYEIIPVQKNLLKFLPHLMRKITQLKHARELHLFRRLRYMHRASNHIIFNLNAMCTYVSQLDRLFEFYEKRFSDII